MSNLKTNSAPFLWHVGLAGLVAPERVIVAARWTSAPIKRAVRKARIDGKLIDLTYGRACKWVIFLDCGYLVLTAVPMPVDTIDDDGYDDYVLNKYGEL